MSTSLLRIVYIVYLLLPSDMCLHAQVQRCTPEHMQLIRSCFVSCGPEVSVHPALEHALPIGELLSVFVALEVEPRSCKASPKPLGCMRVSLCVQL